MNKRKDIVPNKLKECRLTAGFTSEERISHWEKGKNIPNLFNLFKLARIYKTTPMFLYPELDKN